VEADGPLAAVVAGGLPVALQQRQRNPAFAARGSHASELCVMELIKKQGKPDAH